MDNGNECYDSPQQQHIRFIIMAVSSGLSVLGSILTLIAFFYFPPSTALTEDADPADEEEKKLLPGPPSPETKVNIINESPQHSSRLLSRDITSIVYDRALVRGKRRPTIIKLVISLATADLLLSGEILTYHILLLTKGQDIFKSEDTRVCQYMRAFYQFGAIATFIWTGNIAWTVYRMLMKNQDFKPRQTGTYWVDITNQVATWGFSAAVGIVFVVVKDASAPNHHGWCTPQGDYEWVFWFVPLFTAVLWNTVFYIIFVVRLRTLFGFFASEWDVITKIQRRLSLYLLVFVICWIWDLIIHFLRVGGWCTPFALYVLQELISPLQGFLNFIVYTRSKMIKWSNPFAQRKPELLDPADKSNEGFNEIDDAFAQAIQTNINTYYHDK